MGDDEQQQEEEQEQEPQLLQLIDIEEWFNIHGLRAAVAGNNEGDDDEHDHEHEEHGDQREIRHQVNLEREYQNEIHAKIFNAEDNEEEKEIYPGSSCCSPNSKRRRRQQQLDDWGKDAIDILTTTTMNTEG